MNKLVFVDALSHRIVSKQTENVVFDIRPWIGYEPKSLKLWFFQEVQEVIWILGVKNELFSLFLYLLFGNGLHVLKLLLPKNVKSNWLHWLVSHSYIAGVHIILNFNLFLEKLFEPNLHFTWLFICQVSW